MEPARLYALASARAAPILSLTCNDPASPSFPVCPILKSPADHLTDFRRTQPPPSLHNLVPSLAFSKVLSPLERQNRTCDYPHCSHRSTASGCSPNLHRSHRNQILSLSHGRVLCDGTGVIFEVVLDPFGEIGRIFIGTEETRFHER